MFPRSLGFLGYTTIIRQPGKDSILLCVIFFPVAQPFDSCQVRLGVYITHRLLLMMLSAKNFRDFWQKINQFWFVFRLVIKK